MRKSVIALLLLVFVLAISSAQAKEVNSFTVSDGQASYTFALAETGMKLFYYSYQNPGYADMRSRVFAYEPLGAAPLDSPVMRAEIASKVRWLFLNEMVHLDTLNPVELPQGLICYSTITNSDGSSLFGMGLRFSVKAGTIQRVEAAMSNKCSLQKQVIDGYEAEKSGSKGKKKK